MTARTTFSAIAAGLGIAAIGAAAWAAHGNNPSVGGEPMFAGKTIVANAVESPDHTTLVAAVKAAGLVDTLQSEGPFTVFAPVNSAFAELPDGTVETLLKPENKGTLTSVLTYHVVPGNVSATDLMGLIEANGGAVELETAAGAKLTAKMNGPMNVVIEDGRGMAANIVTYDVYQSNGVIHSVDQVLLPE